MKLGILLTVILLMATSCQKTPSTESPTKSTSVASNAASKDAIQFRVVESIYPISDSFGDVYVKWAAVIENPNAELYGVFPTISITEETIPARSLGHRTPFCLNYHQA